MSHVLVERKTLVLMLLRNVTAILLLFIATVERAQAKSNFLQVTAENAAFHFRTSSSDSSCRITGSSRRYRLRHHRRPRKPGPHPPLLAMDSRRDDHDDTVNAAKKRVGKEPPGTTIRSRSATTLRKATLGRDRFVLPVAEFVHSNSNNNYNDDETTIIRLGIEPGPLIGGPSWLPVHVKVVLQQFTGKKERVDKGEMTGSATTATAATTSSVSLLSSSLPSFAWDFVPIRARDEATLKEIMQLRSVPGKIRFFASGKRVDEPEQLLLPSSSFVSAAFALQTSQPAAAAAKNDDDGEQPDTTTLLLRPLYQWATHAQTFCHGYANRDLHFIFNNCWTFAFQLCVHLLLLDKQQQQQQQQQDDDDNMEQ